MSDQPLELLRGDKGGWSRSPFAIARRGAGDTSGAARSFGQMEGHRGLTGNNRCTYIDPCMRRGRFVSPPSNYSRHVCARRIGAQAGRKGEVGTLSQRESAENHCRVMATRKMHSPAEACVVGARCVHVRPVSELEACGSQPYKQVSRLHHNKTR